MPEMPGWLSEEKGRLAEKIYHHHLSKVARYLKEEIEEMGIDDTGRLIRSIRIDEKAGSVVMRAPYGTFVEEGRRPGGRMPPYKKIRKWVGHKLGITGRREARNVAWAIMRKIQKKGIPATWILTKAWKRALD